MHVMQVGVDPRTLAYSCPSKTLVQPLTHAHASRPFTSPPHPPPHTHTHLDGGQVLRAVVHAGAHKVIGQACQRE